MDQDKWYDVKLLYDGINFTFELDGVPVQVIPATGMYCMLGVVRSLIMGVVMGVIMGVVIGVEYVLHGGRG